MDMRETESQRKTAIKQILTDIIRRYDEKIEAKESELGESELNVAREPEIELGEDIDEASILEDVVNEQYSLKDVKIACEGEVEKQDPVEVSVLQLFDTVHDKYKEQNREILQAFNPQNFLDLCDADDLTP